MPIEPINDPNDPRLDDYRNLTDAQARDCRGAFIAEGRFVVRTLLTASSFRPRSVLVTAAALESLRDLLIEPETPLPPIYLVPASTLDSVVGFHLHRGCLAAADRGEPRTTEDLLRSVGPGPSTLLALENINNHDNVGGIFRNAAAFAAAGVLLSAGCVDPLYRKAVRVSMGGVLRIPFAHMTGPNEWTAALALFRSQGFRILALTPRDGATDLRDFAVTRPIPPRTILLLGSEGYGLSDTALAAADECVRIAIVPGVDSLNVATTSGIALHALAR